MAKLADPARSGEMLTAATETTPLLNATEVEVAHQNGTAVPVPANSHKAAAAAAGGGGGGGGEDGEGEENDDGGDDDDVEREKAMPVLQILLLCLVSLSEPIAYFAIFPFMPEMVHRVGRLPQADVGFWTGMIESLFSLVQMVLMIFYGRAADRWGRKPVLVFSLAGVSVFTALFGMSTALWMMVASRCMAGVFAGSVVTIRTMISENCTKRAQARAFGWYMFTRNLGIFLGPLIGGTLANPAEQFPSVFGRSAFLIHYPYALSTFAAGTFCLINTLAALFGIKETLNRPDAKSISAAPSPPLSTWSVLSSPGVPIVLYIYGHTMLLGLAYTAVSPVFLYTDVRNGGYGFTDQQIAMFLAGAGASQAMWMLLAFPPLQRRFGTGNVLRGCAVAWPFMMAAYPVGNELLRHKSYPVFWILFVITMVGGSGVSMGFACVQLCINDISPSSAVLATVNALALTVNSGVRAFAPVAFTSLYAVGVRKKWADGHLIWFVLVFVTSALNVAVYFLPAKAEGRYDQSRRAEDGESAVAANNESRNEEHGRRGGRE